MEQCLHNKTKPFKAVKEFVGQKFSYGTTKCEDCGGVLWTKQVQTEFNKWVNGLKGDDLFTVQKILLSSKTMAFIQETMENRAVSFSSVVKGTLSFYCKVVLANDKLVDFTNEAFEKLQKNGVDKPKKISKNKKVRLGASLYQSVYGFAELSGLSLTSFVQDAVERALAPLVLANTEKIEIEQRFTTSLDACLAAAA
jgi:predicted HicB family RNase H-like nuclease